MPILNFLLQMEDYLDIPQGDEEFEAMWADLTQIDPNLFPESLASPTSGCYSPPSPTYDLEEHKDQLTPPPYVPTPLPVLEKRKRRVEEEKGEQKRAKMNFKPKIFQNFNFVHVGGYHVKVPDYFRKSVRQFRKFVPKGKIIIKWDKDGNMTSARLRAEVIGPSPYELAQLRK